MRGVSQVDLQRNFTSTSTLRNAKTVVILTLLVYNDVREAIDMNEIAADGLPRLLPAYDDGIFKSTFIRDGVEPALADMIGGFTDLDLTSVIIRNNEIPKRDIDAKREIFDINCIAYDKTSQHDVEMMAHEMRGDSGQNDHAQIRYRSVFNVADLHASQPGRGVNYDKLQRSFQIMICNYCPFTWEHKLIERFMMRSEQGYLLADSIISVFVDLTKTKEIVKKPVSEMTPAEMWSVFIAKADDSKFFELINEISKRRKVIGMAREALTMISKDEQERARFRSRRMAEMDRASEAAAVMEEGRRKEREIWQVIVADKDAAIADKDAEIEKLRKQIAASQGI